MTALKFKKLQKLALCLFISVSLVFLPGCWDRKEVNDILIVLGAGIDKKGDEIEVSIQMINPRKTGGGGGGQGNMGGSSSNTRPSTVRSATGITVADALARLQEKIPRKINWGHVKLLIIGEELAKTGICKKLDYFIHQTESRLHSFVFVSQGRAADLLEIAPPLEQFSVEQMRELAKMRFGLLVTTSDLLQMLKGETGAAVLPWVEEAPPRSGKPTDNTTIRLNGIAVFKKDKMVGYLDDRVTRGVLWVRNEIQRATVTVEPDLAKGYVSLYMLRAHSELQPKIENSNWTITIKTVTEDDVIENTTLLNLMDPKVVHALEKNAETDLEDRIMQAATLAQKKMNTDIFGFAEAFHRRYPKQWASVKNRWDEIFPTIKVVADTKVDIRRPGMVSTPPFVPSQEVKKKEKEIKTQERR